VEAQAESGFLAANHANYANERALIFEAPIRVIGVIRG
jgi:hypothetical protein